MPCSNVVGYQYFGGLLLQGEVSGNGNVVTAEDLDLKLHYYENFKSHN